MLAVMHGKTGCMEKLIQAGANVCYAFLLFFLCSGSLNFKGKSQWPDWIDLFEFISIFELIACTKQIGFTLYIVIEIVYTQTLL